MATRELNRRREDLATLDAAIRMFEPNSHPELIAPFRPVGKRSPWFRGNGGFDQREAVVRDIRGQFLFGMPCGTGGGVQLAEL